MTTSSKHAPLLQASASLKKQLGVLSVTKRKLMWTSSANATGEPDLIISCSALTSLLESKAGAVDRKLRVVHGTDDPPTFFFPDGDDCERFKAHLSPIVVRNKEKAAAALATGSGDATSLAGTSEAQPIADELPAKDAGPGSSYLRAAGVQSKGLNKNELKAAVLLRSPELARLHANLVMSGHITEAEFWDSRENLILAEAAAESQRRGKNGLIVDPRPVRDESGNATMRLTNEMIEDIFEEFPVVRRAYDENVPKKINDQQFWTRYVKSKLASRNSASARGAASEHTVQDDPIFDKYLEKEDDDYQPRRQMGPVSKRLIDLDATAEDHPETGNNQDITMQAGKQRQALPLIRRFNEHSQRLLDSALGSSEPPSKRRKLTPVDGNDEVDDDYMDQIVIDDLQAPPSTVGILLEMKDRQKYFEGSRAVDSKAAALDDVDAVDLPAVLPALIESVRDWAADMANMRLDKEASGDALLKMTQSVRARLDVKSRKSDFPDDILEEMTSLQTATSEFLRQFWSAVYPPPPEQGLLSVASPAQLAERAAKMAKYLARTQGKVSTLVQKGAQMGMDGRRIDAAFAPTLTAVDKALLTHRARTGS
ncbi:RNA polymerase II transcription factor B subunit 1 [Tulasnella sp. JGI-2019a]|nr:RNA polymerase II transcription factor B subunit 1 [Tulasnella sp. JGI-2019a]KAG8995627.1 RNA polymerase II transcription factor B subunit 1 [Tulasnella sp. JGI-2019a]KAG9027268.1 RNA polymerase II transcription factor B subunit 1 [Tulasnella sp. JGI-2019a]